MGCDPYAGSVSMDLWKAKYQQAQALLSRYSRQVAGECCEDVINNVMRLLNEIAVG